MMRKGDNNKFGCFTETLISAIVKTVTSLKGLKRIESNQRESGKAPLLCRLFILWPSAFDGPLDPYLLVVTP